MKKLLLFLLFGVPIYAQTTIEKYNNILNRYEYFDSHNNMVGYKQYNAINSSWDYFDTTKSNTSNIRPQEYPKNLTASYDTDLMYKALAYKQGQFDNNVQGVQNAINDISHKIDVLNVDDELKTSIHDNFTVNYINELNSKHYDYSNSTTASQIINWLYSGAQSAVKVETERYVEKRPAALPIPPELNKFRGTRKARYALISDYSNGALPNTKTVDKNVTVDFEGNALYAQENGVSRTLNLSYTGISPSTNSFTFKFDGGTVSINNDYRAVFVEYKYGEALKTLIVYFMNDK